MKRFYALIVVILGLLSISSPIAAKEMSVLSLKSGNTLKKGLVKEGKNFYYYSRYTGKIVKDKLVKVGKYKYGFDKRGRLVYGKTARIAGFIYHFDAKGRALICESKNNGTFFCEDTVSKKIIYARHTLRIMEKTASGIIAKAAGSSDELYRIPEKMLKGKVFRSLKIGDKIQIWFDGMVLESSPAQYVKIFKAEKK